MRKYAMWVAGEAPQYALTHVRKLRASFLW